MLIVFVEKKSAGMTVWGWWVLSEYQYSSRQICFIYLNKVLCMLHCRLRVVQCLHVTACCCPWFGFTVSTPHDVLHSVCCKLDMRLDAYIRSGQKAVASTLLCRKKRICAPCDNGFSSTAPKSEVDLLLAAITEKGRKGGLPMFKFTSRSSFAWCSLSSFTPALIGQKLAFHMQK